MRKTLTSLTAILVLVCTFFGCDGPDLGGGKTPPRCNFDSQQEIAMTDFGLRIPSGMSTYFKNVFNQDVIYDLIQILDTDGNYSFDGISKASISGNIKSDGKYCIGEKPFAYSKGNPNVMINSIKVPEVTNTGFHGEVTITIRTDEFHDDSGGVIYYYVRWKTSSNNPDQFVNGDLMGEKVTVAATGGVFIPADDPIYLDGQYQ
jgi:hypothetical protein